MRFVFKPQRQRKCGRCRRGPEVVGRLCGHCYALEIDRIDKEAQKTKLKVK